MNRGFDDFDDLDNFGFGSLNDDRLINFDDLNNGQGQMICHSYS